MSDFSERIVIRCPLAKAARHLSAYIASNALPGRSGSVRLHLRLPAKFVEKPVVATLHPLRSLDDPYPTYSVVWEPEGGGPFPTFAGALAVEHVTEDAFRLILAGHYEPPFGAPGQTFDAAAGRWIARAAARELLRTIATFIEQAGGLAL
ncbi:MAG: hypothetical protein ABR591_12570 [Candidatus Velthaea sp.]